MRKALAAVLLVVAIAVSIACWVAVQRILGAAPASGSYEAAARCAGELPWLPMGWLLGPFLLFLPQQTFEWLLEPLPGRYTEGQFRGRALLVLRFAGLALLMSALLRTPGMLPHCGPFYRLLWGRQRPGGFPALWIALPHAIIRPRVSQNSS